MPKSEEKRDRPTEVRSEDANCRTWSDAALATAAVCHHEEAYAELYRRHAASLATTAKMILGGGPGPDDIVAEVFSEFWFSASAPAFDPGRGSLLSYLRLRARSKSMDVLRSEKSRRRREEEELHGWRDPAVTIDAALLASETAAALRSAVGLLPTAEREVIQLAFFDGMTYRAVALHLRLAEGTVKSRIRNGLRRLRVADGAPLTFPPNGNRPERPLRLL